MTDRPKAPGRAYQGVPGEWWGDCIVEPYCETADQDGDILSTESLAAAADALRKHLRTEHPELFEECAACEGTGNGWYYLGPCWGCRGRGWVLRA